MGQFYALISPPGGSVLRAHFHIVNSSAVGVKETGTIQDFRGNLGFLLYGQWQLVQTLADSRQKTGGGVAIIDHLEHWQCVN